MLYYKMVRTKPVESVVWVPIDQPPTGPMSRKTIKTIAEIEASMPGWTCMGYNSDPKHLEEA